MLNGYFIKFGQEIYISKLLKEGEIFMNSVEYYKQNENIEIGDKHEGISYCKPIKSISINGKFLDFENGYVIQNRENQNEKIYCLFYIGYNYVKENIDINGNLKINLSNYKEFGDSCLLIKAKEFTERLYNIAKERKLEIKGKLVSYYDKEKKSGTRVTPFMKEKKYEHQNEFRFLIEDTKKESLKFSIGSIEDIAQEFSIDKELKITFDIEINLK